MAATSRFHQPPDHWRENEDCQRSQDAIGAKLTVSRGRGMGGGIPLPAD